MLGPVATYLGVERIDEAGITGAILAWDDAGWEIRGQITARLTQACVVSLEPVEQVIDQAAQRRYLPQAQMPDSEEIVVGEDDDSPDPFTDSIDLAGLLLEELALAIDPYPRASGAELEQRIFAAPGIAPMTDEDARPFAKLAALKHKLGPSG